MAQAKTLNKQELKRVLDYNDACERHSERNRAMLLFTHFCGMRIGEVVALRVSDVIDDNGLRRSVFKHNYIAVFFF